MKENIKIISELLLELLLRHPLTNERNLNKNYCWDTLWQMKETKKIIVELLLELLLRHPLTNERKY